MLNIERSIYNLVKKNPRIKDKVRNYYQLALSLIPVKEEVINNSLVTRKGFFFGFHDKIPWSKGNDFLLANKFNIPNRKITAGDTLEIGVFTGPSMQDFHSLGVTKSFNWQQGCMLQWAGDSERLIYNDFDGDHHISRMMDTKGSYIKKFDIPVAALSPDGKYALSYSFARLAQFAPGYGYENGTETDNHLMAPETQYLNLLDLETGAEKKLFSLKDIAGIKPEPSMEKAFHYFTHCLFSPSGNRFVFYHRWVRDMNFVNTRMFSCNADGSDLFLYPTNGMVSHIGWKDNDHILAYCSTKNDGDAYVLFTDKSVDYSKTGDQVLTSDGHPSYNPADNRYFITDTYPDRFRLITLILFDHIQNTRTDLARLRQPLSFRDELRCDFHPRWNRSGTTVCFDSAHTGVRSLCTLDIKDILQN